MTGRKHRFSNFRERLSGFASYCAEHRAIVLIGLIVLAALPGLVNFEWQGSNTPDSEFSPFSRKPTSHGRTDGADGRGKTFSESAAVDVEWESYSNLALADEQEQADFDCMIEPWETVSIRSPIIGRIDAIHVERADLVKKGDMLVELDADLSKAELEMARQRAEMTASVRAYEARSMLGSKRSKRAQELFSRDAMALDERDAILMEKQVADFDLEDARDQHDLARLQLNRENAHFQQRRIRSPFDGVVADRLMSVGEVVDEETVLELAQIDPLRVEVILPAIQFGSIHSGMKAAVVPEIPGDEVVVATVRVVDRVIDSASGTFGAQLELPNPSHAIPGGLRCRVRFQDSPSLAADPSPEVETKDVARGEPSQP